MSFYQLLFSRKLNGINRNLTWYWNLFAKYMRENVGTLLAKILKIKGNTLVWNQNGTYATLSTTTYGVTITNITGGYHFVGQANHDFSLQMSAAKLYAGHKYYISGFPSVPSMGYYFVRTGTSGSYVYDYIYSNGIYEPAVDRADGTAKTSMNVVNGADFTAGVDIIPQLFDLTQMFGAGNEPTAEEFTSLFPLPYYSYDSGSLLSFGYINYFHKNDLQIGKNWIYGSASDRAILEFSVKPNTDYHFRASTLGSLSNWIVIYKTGFNTAQISNTDMQQNLNFTVTTPSTCNVICIQFQKATAITSADFVGDFEVTEVGGEVVIKITKADTTDLDTLSLPISTYFPDGMLSAGSVYDELTPTSYVKRVKTKDLSELTWYYDPNGFFYTSALDWDMPKIANSLIHPISCANYNVANFSTSLSDERWGSVADKTIAYHCSSSISIAYIYIKDTSFNGNVTNFTNALNGVSLYYATKSPTEVSIDPPLDLSYEIEWGGTEQLLPENTSTPTTSPISATVEYPDGEHEDYYTYQEIEKNHLRLNRALSIMLGRNVLIENPQEPLDIIMRGE